MISFKVPDMSCGHCRSAIEKSVAAVDPCAKVEVGLTNRLVSIQSEMSSDILLSAFEDAGYQATVVDAHQP